MDCLFAGASKDLWASGVFQKRNESKAALALKKSAMASAQLEFERTLEEQLAMRGAVLRMDDETKKLEAELRVLKDEHERLTKLTMSRMAGAAELRARAVRMHPIVSDARGSITKVCVHVCVCQRALYDVLTCLIAQFLHEIRPSVDGEYWTQLEALYQRSAEAPMLVRARHGSGDLGAPPTPRSEAVAALRMRDPLAVPGQSAIVH